MGSYSLCKWLQWKNESSFLLCACIYSSYSSHNTYGWILWFWQRIRYWGKSTREMNERNRICLRCWCSQGITDLSLEIKQRNSNASKCKKAPPRGKKLGFSFFLSFFFVCWFKWIMWGWTLWVCWVHSVIKIQWGWGCSARLALNLEVSCCCFVKGKSAWIHCRSGPKYSVETIFFIKIIFCVRNVCSLQTVLTS